MLDGLQRSRRHAIRLVRKAFSWGPAERLLLRFTPHTTVDDLPIKLAPQPADYAPGTLRRCERYGLLFDVDLSDIIGWYVYFGFSDPSHDELLALCRPGMTVLDVGANIGITAMRAARAVGPSGRVLAFEPSDTNFRRCDAHVRLNGLANVRTFNVGLAAASGTGQLASNDPRNSGMFSIIDAARAPGSTEAVQLRTLDEIVESQGLDRVDVVKIDVEGYEVQVLRGAEKTLARFRPHLYVEIIDEHLRAHGSSAAELITLLEGSGYRVTLPSEKRTLRPTDDLAGLHIDVLCIPSERL